jgi:F-type H+-transporting ATPase subunit epsilon
MPDGKTFACLIITPEAQVFDDDVQFVALPAHDVEIGILRDRAPLLCKLGIGVLRVKQAGERKRWFVDGGFAQVIDNRVTVLTQRALPPEAVDRAVADQAMEQARQMPSRDESTQSARNDAIARARAQLKLLASP